MGYKKDTNAETLDNLESTDFVRGTGSVNETINGLKEFVSGNLKVSTTGSNAEILTLANNDHDFIFRINDDEFILKIDTKEILKIQELSTTGGAQVDNLRVLNFQNGLQINNPSGTSIDNGTGSSFGIRQRANGGNILIAANDTGGTQRTAIQVAPDGTNVDVILHYNGSEKLKTTANGIALNDGTNDLNINASGGSINIEDVVLFDSAISVNSAIQIDENGILLLGTGDKIISGAEIVNSEVFRVNSGLNTAPSSATDTGIAGEIRYTSDYIYVCVATDTWKRTPLTTW